MKITIDTKEDSPEEIRKLIRMLAALIGDSGSGDYGPAHSQPASEEGLFDMFGDPVASTTEQQQLGSGGEGSEGSGSSGVSDINDFIDRSAAERKEGSDSGDEDDDQDLKVVPY